MVDSFVTSLKVKLVKEEQQLISKMAVFAPKWRVWAVAAP